MPEVAKRRLARMIAERDVPLVEDDVYGDLSFARGRPPCVKAFDREGRVLTCSSFSKTLVPGWRVGCIFPGRYRESVLLHKFALNMCTSSAPQHAVARFLDSGSYDRHLRRMCAAVAATARQMGAVITATFPEGTRVSRPSGGLVLWVELPRAVDALELYRQALDAGISLVPGHLFGPHGGYERFVRLSCAHPWGDPVRRAVETVGRLATRLQGAR